MENLAARGAQKATHNRQYYLLAGFVTYIALALLASDMTGIS